MPPRLRPYDERIEERRVIDDNGCWNWPVTDRNGYGRFRVGSADIIGSRTMAYTHRVAYETFVGPVPEGLELDHLCRNRACCNPEHLEPVTRRENARRGRVTGPRDTCKRGHEFTPENTYTFPNGRRNCRACRKARGGN